MKAKDLSGSAPGGERKLLKDHLPLTTPYVVQFFPIYACNFSCGYCHFSVDKKDRGFVTDEVIMDYYLFAKCIDELKIFPEKVRTLRFVGMGEPLLHRDIADMVAYAVKSQVAINVELLTNGSLLTNKMSDSLVAAGLTRLVVSLQGTSGRKYEEISNISISFNEFVNNLKYFYDNKKDTHMYLKIVDCALDEAADKEEYYKIFGDICDTIGIENAVPIFPKAVYNEVLKSAARTQFGLPFSYVSICPQPFYIMQINPDGKVVGCHSIPYPQILGDCNNETLNEIWNGRIYNNFRRSMLNGRGQVCDVCAECNIMNYRFFSEDDIGGDVERLKDIYK